MDVVGKEYVAEAGCIVSLCGKGKYGNIYKVNGVVIIDKTFSTKNVDIDSFLDIGSGYISNLIDDSIKNRLVNWLTECGCKDINFY